MDNEAKVNEHAAKERAHTDAVRQKELAARKAELDEAAKTHAARLKAAGVPTIGRIVHVFSNVDGELGRGVTCAAGIVTQSLHEGRINVHVFRNGENSVPMTSIPHAFDKEGYAVWWDWPVTVDKAR